MGPYLYLGYLSKSTYQHIREYSQFYPKKADYNKLQCSKQLEKNSAVCVIIVHTT